MFLQLKKLKWFIETFLSELQGFILDTLRDAQYKSRRDLTNIADDKMTCDKTGWEGWLWYNNSIFMFDGYCSIQKG